MIVGAPVAGSSTSRRLGPFDSVAAARVGCRAEVRRCGRGNAAFYIVENGRKVEVVA